MREVQTKHLCMDLSRSAIRGSDEFRSPFGFTTHEVQWRLEVGNPGIASKSVEMDLSNTFAIDYAAKWLSLSNDGRIKMAKLKWMFMGVAGVGLALAGIAWAQQQSEMIIRNGLIV